MAMNSLCRALARVAISQPTAKRIPPPLILLRQQSSSYRTTTTKEEHDATITIPTKTPPSKKKPPSSSDWPRPKEIPFQAKVANSINLIGYVDMPIQTHVLSPDGKFYAATAISQEPSYHSPALWIPVIFEGDLAHVAASHLNKGDYVYIAGQLNTDPPTFPEIQDQAQVQVMVQNINFIEGSFQMKKNLPQQLEEGPLHDYANTKKDGSNWSDLLQNPNEWWDYRISKHSGLVKSKHPDFKHKDSGQAIWLTGAPRWVLSGIEKVKFDVKPAKREQAKQKKEEFWKDLVENPTKWWDNRANKKNPKAPDFKHKETGEVLWLNTIPTSLLPKLPPPKSAEMLLGEGWIR